MFNAAMRRLTKTHLVVVYAIALTAVAVMFGTVRLATASHDPDVIHGCVSNNGTVRIVESPADCKNNDTPIEWNITGPQGEQGLPGAQGEQGLQGPQGEPGAAADLTVVLARLDALEAQSAAQQTTIDGLTALLAGATRGPDALGNDTLLLSGMNVQLVNGAGTTDTSNGLGNLVIGYNADNPIVRSSASTGPAVALRTGSHYLVVGDDHEYTAFGGTVIGLRHWASGGWASVSGGLNNEASGMRASVSGGRHNLASGLDASVSGGQANVASGNHASVSGGFRNLASGQQATVSGGQDNVAGAPQSSVSGGQANEASGTAAAVSGGQSNLASGEWSTVSGGQTNEASGQQATVSGGQVNLARGIAATVSGGFLNEAGTLGGHLP